LANCWPSRGGGNGEEEEEAEEHHAAQSNGHRRMGNLLVPKFDEDIFDHHMVFPQMINEN
jgi:hypothetical protein